MNETSARPISPPQPVLLERRELEVQDLVRRLVEAHRPKLPGVAVLFHENSTTMASKSERGSRAVLRLHRIFRSAPEDVLAAVVRCFFSRLEAGEARRWRALVKDFIRLQHRQVLTPTPSSRLMPPRGSVFDLEEVLRRVSGRWFPSSEPVEIAWSRRVLRRLMGKWIEHPKPLRNLILINRLLDSPEVPEYYLEFLVFHELLHQTIPAHRSCGRWLHHSPEFRAREREFPEYRRALQWERRNVDRLFRKHQNR